VAKGLRRNRFSVEERVDAWLRLFTLWYNLVRPHQSL